MKTVLLPLIVLCALAQSLGAGEPVAANGAALAKASRCYSCHHATDVLIGPPYQAIAARYAGDKTVMSQVLAKKILLGGGGNWGDVPMVPNEHVKPADALTLARWILEQAPGKSR